MELKQGMRQSQSLQMSVQIKQAIKILTLGRQELENYVSDELKENPCLEEMSKANVEPVDAGTTETSESLGQLEAHLGIELPNAGEFLSRLNEQCSPGMGSQEEYDSPLYDRIGNSENTLYEELEEQLHVMHLTAYELATCLEVAQYLDDSGFIAESPAHLASILNLPVDDVAYAISVIQKCEPTGIGARDTQDCLLIQLREKQDAPRMCSRILKEFWVEFEKQEFSKISKVTKIDLDEIMKAAKYIKTHLDPRPARQFGCDVNQTAIPDVFIFKRGDTWVVSLNEDGLPRVKISSKYEQLLIEFTDAKKRAEKSYVNEKLKNAKWFVRALQERNKTIQRVAEVILDRQLEFFESGVEHLKPMTLKNIADELGLHESTISRTTSSKFIHTPRGLYEFKFFFNAAMSGAGGAQIANEVVKVSVAEMIKNEDIKHPLSDQEISDKLEKEKGIAIARRTVAKYREELGYESSSKRIKRI